MGRKVTITFGEQSPVEGQSRFPSLSYAHSGFSSASTPGTPEGCDAWETRCSGSQGRLKEE